MITLFVLAPVVSGGALVGCSSSEEVAGPVADDAAPAPSTDVEAGAVDAAEAGACTDCEIYPAECAEDRVCAVAAPLGQAARLRSIAGTSANDVWVVGTKGTVLHFDGASWRRSPLDVLDSFASVIALSPEEAWIAATMREVYVRAASPSSDGGAGEWQPFVPAEVEGEWVAYDGVVAAAYAAGGPAWFAALDSQTSIALTRARRKDEGIETARLTSFPTPSSIHALHAVSKDEVWAVGAVGGALRITGASGDAPDLQSFNTQTLASLRGVWASGSDDVWAVGSEGTVRRFRGSGVIFDIVPDVPVDVTLRAVGGTASDDVWAVGDGAVVLHFDGVTWSRVPVAGLGERRPDLYAVFCPERGRVWAAGDGVLLSLGKTI